LLFANKKGHIFNMCSVASKTIFPNASAYCISKFALLGFSKVLRAELKDKQIKVTSLLPGATWSNAWAGVELPKERIMQAEDIAKVVWSAYHLGDSAVVEEIILRPQLGDL
jgi:short-subunit dehydrogenase